MVKHSRMALLNNHRWTLFFGIMLVSFQQGRPEIDLEKVKTDFITTEGHGIPTEYIQKKKNSMFKIFYTNNTCFVHLGYKDYLSEPQMKPSAVAIYLLINGKWKHEKILPYYYDMSIKDPLNGIFLSQNIFCEPTGACSSYLELSAYKDGDFKKLASYIGYNKVLYYTYVLGQNDFAKLSKIVGDTIAIEYDISDLRMESKGGLAFKLTQKVSILENITDTLNVSRSIKSSFVRTNL